jgi:phenylalanyl-tRNA synthetase beta chain
VVDITNYVMLEYGQPLHAFDYDLLAEHRIVARRARDGETITTIDGSARALPADTLVIADANRAVAVAGVMGGLDSEISEKTTTVLLESAAFDALSIRRAAKALGMSTDSSYRFERGVDPNGVAAASDRAAQLIAELAGGTVAQGVLDIYPAPVEPRPLSLRPQRCNAVLGTQFAPQAMVEALRALQFQPDGTDPIAVTVPTWRPDIQREDDLAEEVGRLLGYDLIPAAPPSGENLHGGVSGWERFRRRVHRAGLACGWQEAVTSTLIEDDMVTALGLRASARLSNPLSREVNVIRPSLLPGLVDVGRRNLRHGRGSLGFFELGRVYQFREGEPHEDFCLAAATLGPMTGASWTAAPPTADFFTLKGALDAILGNLNAPRAVYTPDEMAGFHPGRAARVTLNGHPIGVLGELHPQLAERWDIRGRLVLFEVSVSALHHASGEEGFRALPRFPGITRDISFVTNRAIPQARISEVIAGAAGPLLTDLTLFDVYRGERLGEDQQSMAYHLTLRAEDRTLSDAEAAGILASVRTALEQSLGIAQRE